MDKADEDSDVTHISGDHHSVNEADEDSDVTHISGDHHSVNKADEDSDVTHISGDHHSVNEAHEDSDSDSVIITSVDTVSIVVSYSLNHEAILYRLHTGLQPPNSK